jgi:predicted metalloendopeptidase
MEGADCEMQQKSAQQVGVPVDEEDRGIPSERQKTQQVHSWLTATRGVQHKYILMWAVILLGAIMVIAALAIQLRRARTTSINSNNRSSSSSDTAAVVAAQLLSSMDASTQPCQDFYTYACGGWTQVNSIPADQSSYARSFNVIHDRNLDKLQTIMTAGWPIVAPFYRSCMDEARLDEVGVAPLAPLIAQVEGTNDAQQLLVLSATLAAEAGVSGLVTIVVTADPKVPNSNLLSISQGGLSLPSAKYYSDDEMRADLTAHIARMFKLVEPQLLADTALQQASAVVELERKLAGISLPLEALRDPESGYNIHSLQSLAELAPAVPWKEYIHALGIAHEAVNGTGSATSVVKINVDTPSFVAALSTIISNTPLQTLQQYFKWQTIKSTTPWLSSPLRSELFAFFSKRIRGVQQQRPRWKQCTTLLADGLPDLVGRYYVLENFAGENRQVAVGMIADVKQIFDESFQHIPWMDETTRAAARAKIAQVDDLIGYPSNWTDMTELDVRSNAFYENIQALHSFIWKKEIGRLNTKVDRQRWQVSPSTVNAYYDATMNTINFPAGIIQAPFFDSQYPAALNYGAIGVVMGHELAHGFDDQGRQFDGAGTLRQWWSTQAVSGFTSQSQCLVHQYGSFEVAGEFVNGNLTLGENIADNAGLRTAFYAMQLHQQRQQLQQAAHVDQNINIDEAVASATNLNANQLFFLAFAQSWCQLTRPQYQLELLKSDTHAPSHVRVTASLRNSNEFAAAFGCPLGSPMNPRQKCTIWTPENLA